MKWIMLDDKLTEAAFVPGGMVLRGIGGRMVYVPVADDNKLKLWVQANRRDK